MYLALVPEPGKYACVGINNISVVWFESMGEALGSRINGRGWATFDKFM